METPSWQSKRPRLECRIVSRIVVCVAVVVFNQMSTPVVPCSVGRDDVAALNQQQRQRQQQQQPVAHFFCKSQVCIQRSFISLPYIRTGIRYRSFVTLFFRRLVVCHDQRKFRLPYFLALR